MPSKLTRVQDESGEMFEMILRSPDQTDLRRVRAEVYYTNDNRATIEQVEILAEEELEPAPIDGWIVDKHAH